MRVSRLKILFVVWFIGTALIIGILMARHTVPFRMPKGLAAFSQQAAHTTFGTFGVLTEQESKYLAVHVLDVRCGCSRAVLQSLGRLVQRADNAQVKHHVVLLQSTTDDTESADQIIPDALRDASVSIQNLTLTQAKTVFQIESVPWLVVLSKELSANKKNIFNINYMGGYSDRSIASASDVQLPSIIAKITKHEQLKSLPSYGCVTSEQIRQQLLYNP